MWILDTLKYVQWLLTSGIYTVDHCPTGEPLGYHNERRATSRAQRCDEFSFLVTDMFLCIENGILSDIRIGHCFHGRVGNADGSGSSHDHTCAFCWPSLRFALHYRYTVIIPFCLPSLDGDCMITAVGRYSPDDVISWQMFMWRGRVFTNCHRANVYSQFLFRWYLLPFASLTI